MFLEQHIRMISEGSCDNEDWSDAAEIQLCITEINSILKHIQIENRYLKWIRIFYNKKKITDNKLLNCTLMLVFHYFLSSGVQKPLKTSM